MKDEWTVPVKTGEIAKAFAAAQLEMQNPHMDSSNPHFKSRFASLKAVRNAVVPVFAKHGIAVSQELLTDERGVACIVHLYHESGESLRFGPLSMPTSKSDAHGCGSAATYARRYSLMAVAGVVGDEDDDANSAVESGNAPITDKQAADIRALIEEVDANIPAFLKYIGAKDITAIPAAIYGKAISALEAKRKTA